MEKQELRVCTRTHACAFTEDSNTINTCIVGSVFFISVLRDWVKKYLIKKKTTCPTRNNAEVPDVYRAGREEGPFPSHLVASSSEVFAPILTESEENPAEGAPSCPDKCKKVLAVP